MPTVVNYSTDDPALIVKIAAVIEAHEKGAASPSGAPPEASTADRVEYFEFECTSQRNGGGYKRKGYIPVPSVLRHTYLGHDMEAMVISPTTVMFNGEGYDSLTAAAFAAVRSVNPKATRPGGAFFWARETAPGVWTSLYRT